MKKLLLIISFAFLFLSFGCVSKIEDRDLFSSTMNFNLNDYIQDRQSPFPTGEPCTCLVCSKEPESAWYNLFGISSDNTDTALAGAECKFVSCNATSYGQTIGDSEPESGDWSICSMLGSKKICLPKFFMLGSGASSAEFSLAQQYCTGDLSMPVIWTIPQENAPPRTPQPQTLMCHLSKSQMPIVVWDSDGKYIDSPYYSNFLKSLSNLSADPEISGPIMVTTEALAEPYYYDNGKKLLNLTLLNKVKNQITQIEQNCPKCISVLALKPTFNDSQLPDFCPLDYFFTYRPNDPNKDPDKIDYLGCADKYPPGGYINRPATSGFGQKIDLIGIAFNANDNENLATCTPTKSIAQHSIYSRQALNDFYTPSVWYAVAMSEGPTKTPYCAFTQDAIRNSYSDLIRGISGHVSGGIIGIAPYKLIDSPAKSSAFECPQWEMSNSDLTSLKAITSGHKIFFEDGTNIQVSKILQTKSDSKLFRDSKNRTYFAYLDSASITINRTGCQYGLISADGQTKTGAQFSWFSGCQFYYNDRGPLFRTDLSSLSQISAGQYIKSDDGLFKLYVASINSTSKDEVVFFASSGQVIRRMAAQMDGDKVMIYDAPRVPSTQEPLMFSSNGVGGQCSVFEANKMFYRANPASIRPESAPGVQIPQNKDLLEKIQNSQCGNCLSFAPMPDSFCDAKAYLADKNIHPGFKEGACTQYPQMDAVFLEHSLDPVLMRTLGAGESSLGNGIDSGKSAPACAMSSASSACGSNKDPDDLGDYESTYCASQVLKDKAQAIEDAGKKVCALGVFQCIRSPGDDSNIDAPSGDYNPFEPADSAACGVYEFKEKGGRYDDTLSRLRNLKSQYPNIPMFDPSQGGIASNELEWYAAWIAAYHYSGMGVASTSLLQSYVPQDKNDNIVAYTHRYLENYCNSNPDKICYPYYGTKFIIRYNEGIDVCQNGCIPKYC